MWWMIYAPAANLYRPVFQAAEAKLHLNLLESHEWTYKHIRDVYLEYGDLTYSWSVWSTRASDRKRELKVGISVMYRSEI